MRSFCAIVQVEMESKEGKDQVVEKFQFPCGRWLAKDEDDHSIIRELPAEGGPIKKPEKRNKLPCLYF